VKLEQFEPIVFSWDVEPVVERKEKRGEKRSGSSRINDHDAERPPKLNFQPNLLGPEPCLDGKPLEITNSTLKQLHFERLRRKMANTIVDNLTKTEPTNNLRLDHDQTMVETSNTMQQTSYKPHHNPPIVGGPSWGGMVLHSQSEAADDQIDTEMGRPDP